MLSSMCLAKLLEKSVQLFCCCCLFYTFVPDVHIVTYTRFLGRVKGDNLFTVLCKLRGGGSDILPVPLPPLHTFFVLWSFKMGFYVLSALS